MMLAADWMHRMLVLHAEVDSQSVRLTFKVADGLGHVSASRASTMSQLESAIMREKYARLRVAMRDS
jgi:hypothetical protein